MLILGEMNKMNFTPRETQIAIKTIKDFFQISLAKKLNLYRVTAPLFVRPETGLNDNLSGVEKAVNFSIRKYDIGVEIIQSLAKWKRFALKNYGFKMHEGLYTDMNAIRADEQLDPLHSIYVDQWDWEAIISPEERTEAKLIETVQKIYSAFKETEVMISEKYKVLALNKLPEEIEFIHSDELLKLYPDSTPDEREFLITKDRKAVFIIGIGNKLENGEVHGTRSPDYDDWNLNGDIIFWNSILNRHVELSSMGIRVNAESLKQQLTISNKLDRLTQDYHRTLMNNELPQTIGGGIGQSRMCMFFLEKRHIGEVQCSIWDNDTLSLCNEQGISLL